MGQRDSDDVKKALGRFGISTGAAPPQSAVVQEIAPAIASRVSDHSDAARVESSPLWSVGAVEPTLPESGNGFIDAIASGAVEGMHATGVPASAAIAMAILESGWGEHFLAREAFNLFALTGKGPAGELFAADAQGTQPGGKFAFRRYHDVRESMIDFARSLATRFPGVLSHKDHPDSFARALTNTFSKYPSYGETLVRIMRQFDLYRYDRC